MKITPSKFLCVSALSLLAITGCKTVAVNENSAASSVSSTADSKSTAANADPKAVLGSAMKNMQTQQSWIADVEMSGDTMPQGSAKMNIKFAAPDSFQMNNEMSGTKMQMIAVGGKTYIQMNDKWQEAPSSVNTAEMINKWRGMFDPEKMDAFKNIQFAGKETIDGKELAVYTYDIDQQAAIPEEMKKDMTVEQKAELAKVQSENKAKLWIDESKNLPAKMDMAMKMSQPQQLSQTISVKYDFDQPVKIEAPKVK